MTRLHTIAGIGDGWSLSNEGRRVAVDVYGCEPTNPNLIPGGAHS